MCGVEAGWGGGDGGVEGGGVGGWGPGMGTGESPVKLWTKPRVERLWKASLLGVRTLLPRPASCPLLPAQVALFLPR